MKKAISPLVFFCMILLFASCETKYGSGNIITVQKSVPEFDALSVSGGIETEVTKGEQKVVVEADDNLMKFIKTDVVGGKLKISTEIKSLRDAHIKIYITAPALNRLSASAGAEIVVKDEIRSPEKIHLVTSSAGEIETRVDAPHVELDASSGSKIKVSGRTRNLLVESSSGADVEAFGLLAEVTEASSSSGAKAEVYASVSLDASASSGGHIKYRQGGKTQIRQSSGGGVQRVN